MLFIDLYLFFNCIGAVDLYLYYGVSSLSNLGFLHNFY